MSDQESSVVLNLSVFENAAPEKNYAEENRDSIKQYMKALKKFTVLTPEEERRHFTDLQTRRSAILTKLSETEQFRIHLLSLFAADASQVERRKVLYWLGGEDEALVTKYTTSLLQSLQNNDRKTVDKHLNKLCFSYKDLEDFLQMVKPHLPEETSIELAENLKAFNKVKHHLTECNLKLVFSRVQKYLNRGLPIEDLMQEGNIGLLKAIDKFDVKRGWKFSTYAVWWIEQAFGRALADKSRLIRIPVHMVEALYKLVKSEKQLVQKLKREPTIQELTEFSKLTATKIEQIRSYVKPVRSVEEQLNPEGDSLMGFLQDYESEDPFEELARKQLHQKIRMQLSRLTSIEEKVIRLRFGIGEERAHTLEEIGKQFSVTRERIRQIENQQISKLRMRLRKEGNSLYWLNLLRSEYDSKRVGFNRKVL